jgi:hypothetical protein
VLSKINLAVVGTLMVLPHLAVAADNTAARPVEMAGPALPTSVLKECLRMRRG